MKRLFLIALIISLTGLGVPTQSQDWLSTDVRILTYDSLKVVKGLSEASGESIGNSISGRAVTATLYVSPNGDDSDGSSWSTAYTTIQGALAVASADADDLTLIMVGPHATYYDIDTTGDPTFSGNYCIIGSHRNFAKIKNDHAGATSILKFTGRTCIDRVTFDCGTGTNNGIIFSGSGTKGSRLVSTYLECENVTGAQTAIEVSGGTEYIRFDDVFVHGVLANTSGLLINDCKFSSFNDVQFHDCLSGIQITNADSDQMTFTDILFHESTLALNLDAGNKQIFDNVEFFECTTNIDDEVGDHSWKNIKGEFAVSAEPDDFEGIAVDTGDGVNTWSANVEVRASATSTVPFTIVGISLEAGTGEKYRIRLTADGGTTYFTDFQFEGVALGSNSASLNSPSGTGFIFNKGTQVQASSKSESGGVDDLDVWIQVQEF